MTTTTPTTAKEKKLSALSPTGADTDGLVQVRIRLPRPLKRWIAIHCAENEISMQTFAVEVFEEARLRRLGEANAAARRRGA